MGDVNILTDYLNPRKHSGTSKTKGKYHLIRIDSDFLDNNQNQLSEHVTKLILNKLPSKSAFNDVFLRIETQYPLVVTRNGNIVHYYFKRTVQGVNTYVSLEDVLLPGTIDESHFHPYPNLNFIPISSEENIFYYHRVQLKLFSVTKVFPETGLLYYKTLHYNPKELGGLTSGTYYLDYVSAAGKRKTDNTTDFVIEKISFWEPPDVREKRGLNVVLYDQIGELYWYPEVKITESAIVLYYDYIPAKNTHIELPTINGRKQAAVQIEFHHTEGFLAFMYLTYFRNEVSPLDIWGGSGFRKKECFIAYTNIILRLLRNNKESLYATLILLHYIPADFFVKEQTLYKKIDNSDNILGEYFLWLILEKAMKIPMVNYNVAVEDIVLKLLQMLKDVQQDSDLQEKHKNDYVLNQLLTRKFGEKSYLLELYDRMHTSNFVRYNYFIYQLWSNSSYINPKNPIYKNTSYQTKRFDKEAKQKKEPLLMLPYHTEKIIGFYASSVDSEFDEKGNIVFTPDAHWIDNIYSFIDPKGGDAVSRLIEDDWRVTYHPLHPILLPDPSDGNAVQLQRLSPALLVKANEDKSFWSNVGTSAWYAIDALTIFTGLGNLAKFRHLARIAQTSSNLKWTFYAKKALRQAVAYVEITSGTVNALLKITGLDETEFGKALSRFLFWAELLTLSGELFEAIAKGLRSNAKIMLKNNAKVLNKELDDLVKAGKLDEAQKARIADELKATLGKKKFKISKDFRSKYGKKKLYEIDFDLILKNMTGITDEADKIVKHIEDDIIKVHILDDNKFDDLLRKDGYPEKNIRNVTAMGDLDIYLRASTDVDTAMGEIVHEGIHAMDYHKIRDMVKKDLTLEEIIVNFGNSHDFEMRAYLAEQKFQKEGGLVIDHKNYFAIKEHIEEFYPKTIYIEEIIEEISDLIIKK